MNSSKLSRFSLSLGVVLLVVAIVLGCFGVLEIEDEPQPTTIIITESTTQEQTAPPVVYVVYITETGSKYHRGGCRYLRTSCISINLEDAQARGYSPCSVCEPYF